MTQHCLHDRGSHGLRALSFYLFAFLVLFSVAGLATACTSRDGVAASEGRGVALRQIAAQYGQTGDLQQAQSALSKLNLANPGQLLIALAESDMSAGASREDIQATAALAEALGARSQKLVAYLAPPATVAPTQDAGVPVAEPTVLAATLEAPTAVPSPTALPPTVAPTATDVPATPTSAPPTNTPEPQNPRVLAGNDVNLRGGPGKAYGVVGRLRGGQEAPIVGRNASGDWWQLEVPGVAQAWVAGTVVKVLGTIDTVEVAQNIPLVPTAAPRPTAAPQPTAPPPAAAKAGLPFVIETARLRRVGEGAQACNGGDHNIFVTVLDAGGAPLDGVRVFEIWTKQVHVTGAKGPGKAEYDLYKNGGGQVQIVDENNNPLSELSRGLSNTFPDFDLMKAAGYCNCKPHPDDASCASDIANKQYMFAWGHYAYEVVFRRTY